MRWIDCFNNKKRIFYNDESFGTYENEQAPIRRKYLTAFNKAVNEDNEQLVNLILGFFAEPEDHLYFLGNSDVDSAMKEYKLKKVKLLQKLFHSKNRALNQSDDFKHCFSQAVSQRDKEMLDTLSSFFPGEDQARIINSDIVLALQKGDIETVKWLVPFAKDLEVTINKDVILDSHSNGVVTNAQFREIYALLEKSPITISKNSSTSFVNAAKKACETMDFIVFDYIDVPDETAKFKGIYAALEKNMRVVDKIFQKWGVLLEESFFNMFKAIIHAEQLTVFRPVIPENFSPLYSNKERKVIAKNLSGTHFRLPLKFFICVNLNFPEVRARLVIGIIDKLQGFAGMGPGY